MKERPILFSGPMVRAILDGRKTQTRRIMKPQPTYDGFWWSHKGYSCGGEKQFRDGLPLFVGCPYGAVGDRLWVRETFAPMQENRPIANPAIYDNKPAWYRADNDRPMWAGKTWKPSIHMPRWASRITLEITGVRVERLNEISESDAVREGCFLDPSCEQNGNCGFSNGVTSMCHSTAISAFMGLWSYINGPESWAENPFVWVIEFKRIETT